jgi:hypothetical protein
MFVFWLYNFNSHSVPEPIQAAAINVKTYKIPLKNKIFLMASCHLRILCLLESHKTVYTVHYKFVITVQRNYSDFVTVKQVIFLSPQRVERCMFGTSEAGTVQADLSMMDVYGAAA